MKFFLAAILSLLTSQANALSGFTPPAAMFDPLIDQLLEDIKILLRVDLPEDKPIILLTAKDQLVEAYCANKERCNVAAVTDSNTGIIYIDSKLELGNIYNVSILYHELVHFVQVKTSMFSNLKDCMQWASAEMHAYKAQSDWLQFHGVKGFNVPDLSKQCE